MKMFYWITTEKAFTHKLLGLFLMVVLIFGLGSYTAGLGSDPYGIVHFARHLARGRIFSDYPVYNWIRPDWRPDEAYFVLHGNYVIRGGKMYCKYSVGFPLLLALSIRIFGPDSVYFVNIFVLLILLWFYFKLGRMIFSGWAGGEFLALFCPLLLIVLIDQVWALALRPSCDLSALMFLITGLFLGVRAFKYSPRVSYPLLLLGAFCLGYSGTIRLPNVLAGLPAGAYLLARLIGRVRWPRLVAVLVLAVFSFAIALTPAFLQNYFSSADPLRPPRPEIQDTLDAAAESPPSPLWIGFLLHTGPDTLGFFWRLYGPALAFLILLGLVMSRKSKELSCLCLGIPLIFMVFYSMWVHLMTRYMLIAQPFLILLAVAGCGRLFQVKRNSWIILSGLPLLAADLWMRWRLRYEYGMENLDFFVVFFEVSVWILAGWGRVWRARGRFMALSLVLFFLFLLKFGPDWVTSRRIFQLPEARRFGRDIDRIAPEGSVIFATKPISQYIALFSASNCIRPFEIGRIGIDSRRGCLNLLQQGVPLYLFDNSGPKRDAGKALPLFREYFDVTPAGRFRGERYRLTDKFGKPVCTLYKIEPWTRREVEVKIPVPAGAGDSLLMINVGHLWEADGTRGRLDLDLDGRRLEDRIVNNINYLHLPASLLHPPQSTLRLSSDQPLPREVDFRLQDLRADYAVELANQLNFPDKSAIDTFDESRLRDGDYVRLGWRRPGVIAVPTIVLPGTELVGEIKVKKVQELPSPLVLRVALNGEVIAEKELAPGVEWEEIKFPLPSACVTSPRGELEFTAYPRDDYELSATQDRWGALFFESVKVKRHSKEVLLPPADKDDCFLAFRFSLDAKERPCPGPYRVLVDQEEAGSVAGDGVQRLLLKPGRVRRPVSVLRVVSADRSCSALLAPDPFLWSPKTELIVDIGGKEDWAFIEEGFYAEEVHLNKTPVRWTEGTARLIVPLIPRRGEKVSLSLKVVDTGPSRPGPPPEVRIEMRGRKIGAVRLNAGGGVYRIPLSDEPAEPGLAAITVTASPWQPSRYLGTADKRKLGVMLDRLEVKYK